MPELVESTRPLISEDTDLVWGRMILISHVLFAVCVASILFLGWWLWLYGFQIVLAAMVVSLVLGGWASVARWRATKAELAEGVVATFTGTVTATYGGGKGRKGSRIELNGREFSVRVQDYEMARPGMKIRLHCLPKSKRVFRVEMLEP
ncbi:MAG: hypothetical protein L0099_09030 [Acidobacteria bacterium]|nr:hypothetical protein [Acidobacteriota bacterium]